MKVIIVSRYFQKAHPKSGQPTYFIEKITNSLTEDNYIDLTNVAIWQKCGLKSLIDHFVKEPKYHTIRSGSRWKVGDRASLRFWSGLPYKSKQIEFARVEIKKTWLIRIDKNGQSLDGKGISNLTLARIAVNDGLSFDDFESWFNKTPFIGQIICWSDKINY